MVTVARLPLPASWSLPWMGRVRWPLAALVLVLAALGCAVPVLAQQVAPASTPAVPPTRPPPAPAEQAESLPALLARVLPFDPQVRSARSLVEVAAERRIQARSRLGPSVGMSITQGRAAETEFGRAVDRRNDRAEAIVRWNLLNFGNDAAEWRATLIDERAALEELRRAQEDSTERIAGAYLDLLRLESLLPRARERLTAVERLVQQVRRQNELGKLSDADTQQADASLLDAEIVHQEFVADYDGARRKLAVLVGASDPAQVRPVVPLVLPPASLESPAPDMLQVSGPGQVAAAQERARAARERVRPLLSLAAPRVDLELRKQLRDRTTPQLTTEQQHSWNIVARWDFPVGGEMQSRQAEAVRRAEAAEAEADRVANGLSAELASLGPRIAETANTILRLERQIEQYNALVRAGEMQFEAGRRTVAQLIQLREGRFNAEQRRAEQVHRLQSARLRQLALNGALLPALGVTDPLVVAAP